MAIEFDDLVTFAAEDICKRKSDPELCADVCNVCQRKALAIIGHTAEYLEAAGKTTGAAELRAGLEEYRCTPMEEVTCTWSFDGREYTPGCSEILRYGVGHGEERCPECGLTIVYNSGQQQTTEEPAHEIG